VGPAVVRCMIAVGRVSVTLWRAGCGSDWCHPDRRALGVIVGGERQCVSTFSSILFLGFAWGLGLVVEKLGCLVHDMCMWDWKMVLGVPWEDFLEIRDCSCK
jgi:hypothetical protein